MKKVLGLGLVLILLTGLSFSAFYSIEKGKAEKAGFRAAGDESSNQKTSDSTIDSNASYLPLSGGTLSGMLDLAGNRLTGLPSPEDASDAVNRAYLESRLEDVNTSSVTGDSSSNISGSSEYSTPGISDVLDEDRDIGRNLLFPGGLKFGEGAVTADNSFAFGEDANASGRNSFVFGEDAETNQDNTFSIGSSDRRMNLEVSGNVTVDGSLRDAETGSADSGNASSNAKKVWSYSFAVDNNGTEVSVPAELRDSEYAVSVTPVGSMASTGVFNKTDNQFFVKADKFTNVDVIITPR